MSLRSMHRSAVAVVAALLALTGCSSPSDPETAGGIETLALGWTPGPAAPQIPVASDGLWAAESLNVELNTFTSGREALESLMGGGLDAAVLAELPVVTAAVKNSQISVVTTTSTYAKYRVIGSVGRGITDDVSSLQGKKLAITLGTNMHFLISELLKVSGVSAELVNVGPADIVSALARGDVDAAMMFESFYANAQSVLGSEYVEIPIDPNIYTGNMVVAISNKVAEERPAAVQALVTGLAKASQSIKENPAKAQDALVATTGGTLTADYLEKAWGNYDFTPKLDDKLAALMMREGEWLKSQGQADAGLTFDRKYFEPYVNRSFLEKATK